MSPRVATACAVPLGVIAGNDGQPVAGNMETSASGELGCRRKETSLDERSWTGICRLSEEPDENLFQGFPTSACRRLGHDQDTNDFVEAPCEHHATSEENVSCSTWDRCSPELVSGKQEDTSQRWRFETQPSFEMTVPRSSGKPTTGPDAMVFRNCDDADVGDNTTRGMVELLPGNLAALVPGLTGLEEGSWVDTRLTVEVPPHGFALDRTAWSQLAGCAENTADGVRMQAIERVVDETVQLRVHTSTGCHAELGHDETVVQNSVGSTEQRMDPLLGSPQFLGEVLDPYSLSYPSSHHIRHCTHQPGYSSFPIGFSPPPATSNPGFAGGSAEEEYTRGTVLRPDEDDVSRGANSFLSKVGLLRTSPDCVGQETRGDESTRTEYSGTILSQGPRRLGESETDHSGAYQSLECYGQLINCRKGVVDPYPGTLGEGKPQPSPQPSQFTGCRDMDCFAASVFEVKGDGIAMDSSSWPGEGKPELPYSLSQNYVCDNDACSNQEGNHLNPKPLRFSPVVDPSAPSSPDPLGFGPSYGVVGEFPYGEQEIQGPVSDGEGHVQDIDRGAGSSKDAASGSYVEPGHCVQAGSIFRDGNGATVCLSQGPEEDRRNASVGPSDVDASQCGLSSRVVDRQERSDSDPLEAASGTLPGFSVLGFVGLDKSSPRGESTPPSTASQAPNILSPLDLVDHLPKSLLGSQGLDELDRHKTYKVVSSQSVNFPDDVPMSKGHVGRASGTPIVKPTLRQDLTCTLPAWAQARLGAWSSTSQQQRPLLSDSLGFTDSNPARLQPSMPAQMSGLGFPISAGAQAQNSGVTQGRQSLWVTCHEPVATWFSREHVCGSQCFPPLDSKKVRSCAVGADCLSSSSEAWEADSDLQEFSQVVSDLIPPAPEVSVYFQTPNFLRSPAQNPSHKPLGFSPDLPQVQGSMHRNATCDPNHKPLGFSPDLPQVQGSMRRSATCDPSHKPLGFSPDLPQVQGPIGGSINLGQNHESIGFSPDLHQVQGSPCRAVNRDSSYTLLGLCQDAPMAQGSVNSDVNLGPEQYHIHSDDDDGSSASDVEAYLCWEQSWVDLNEPPQDWSSANAGPGILRMPVHEPGAQARRSDAAGVTWHVPIEMPSVSFPKYKTGKLEPFPGPFFFGRLIASQVSGSNISFLPSLACTFMYRLLTLQVRQASGKARQIKQSTCNLVSSGANCWSPLPRLCMRRVLPAPSRPQSNLFLKDTLPGCTSVSGDDCGNALAQACICARWGETSSPDTNFEISLCVEPGQASGREIRSEESEDLNPKSLRFSPSLTREMPRQSDEAGQGELCQYLSHKPVRLSSVPRGNQGAAEVIAKNQAGSTRLMPGSKGARKHQAGSTGLMPGSKGAHKHQAGSTGLMPGSTGAHEDQVDSACPMPGSAGAYRNQADSACPMPGPIGANFKISAPQDEVGRVCFLQGSTGAQEGQAGQCATMHPPQVKRVQPGAQVFPVEGDGDELTNENTPLGQAVAQAQGVLKSGEQRCGRSVASLSRRRL